MKNLIPRAGYKDTQTSDKDTATTVETKPQNRGAGMGANVPNVSQDATEQEPLMAQSDETRDSKTTDFEISRTLREEVQEPGSIVGRSAAVLIAKENLHELLRKLTEYAMRLSMQIGARFDQLDLDTHVTVHEVEFLPAFVGPAGETLNQFQQILDNYGPHLKNLLVLSSCDYILWCF